MADAMTWFYREPSEATFTDIALDLSALEPEINSNGHVADLFAVFVWRCGKRHGYTIPEGAHGRIVERAKMLMSDTPAGDP